MVGSGERWESLVREIGGVVGRLKLVGFEVKVGGVGVLHLKYQSKKMSILINTPPSCIFSIWRKSLISYIMHIIHDIIYHFLALYIKNCTS